MNFKEQCADMSISVRVAMQRLDCAPHKILFLLENDVVRAALTDGDIRRHLLNGGKMDDPVLYAANNNPKTAKNWQQAAELLRQGAYSAIPIISEAGKLTGIAFASEPCSPALPKLGLPVVIMAGGKGTRLDPYTRVLPKPLIPIGELPIIEHIMQRFIAYDCSEFHIIVNYKRQLLKAYFNESEQYYDITWYDEEQPLGTGGGLSMLRERLHSTFFLTNCDILLSGDYADMLKFHYEGGNTITMIGAYKNVTIPYGVVDIGQGGVFKMMQEKPELSFLTNTGMYIAEPQILEDIPKDAVLGFPDIMEGQRQKGRRIAVYPVSEDAWLDMGQTEELERMRKRLYGE